MKRLKTIVAPHPDDEIIGCWEVLSRSKNVTVLYVERTNEERERDSRKITEIFDVSNFMFFHGNYDDLRKEIGKNQTFSELYFPDPYFETHPSHRMIGSIGEEFLRKGYNVIFYSTNMLAPYIHEVSFPRAKRNDLDVMYYSERSLWESDYKYWLFEGYCKWIR